MKASFTFLFLFPLYLFLFLNMMLSSITIIEEKNEEPEKIIAEKTTIAENIDLFLQSKIEGYGIPGMAVAVVSDGELLYKRTFGHANLEQGKRMTDSNLFRLHSLSKVFVVTGIFQLMEEGTLSLNDRVDQYVPGLPEGWGERKLKHLLTHSSGLPDIRFYADLNEEEARKKVFSEPLRFESGEKFEYNQTNFWLINKIVENTCDQSIEELVINGQFGPAMKGEAIFLKGNTSAVIQQATGYYPHEKHGIVPDSFHTPDWLFGAAGLNLSLNAFLTWNKNLDEGAYISPGGKKAMWTPFSYAEEFPFAHGWGLYKVNDFNSFGFTGGGKVGFRKFPKQDLSIVILTNGYEKSFRVDELINTIAGFVKPELADHNFQEQNEKSL
ncbi:serine hydrolase domain-containing protein [Salinimicrobium sp. CAU 1759]